MCIVLDTCLADKIYAIYYPGLEHLVVIYPLMACFEKFRFILSYEVFISHFGFFIPILTLHSIRNENKLIITVFIN